MYTHTHRPTLCTPMIAAFDLTICESLDSQVGLPPVTFAIVFCPLIFQACLSCIDCLLVLDRDGLSRFDMEMFVCLSVWSAEVMPRRVCLPAQSSPLTEDVGQWRRKKHLLVALLPSMCGLAHW